jgi:hypothetical protein
MSNKELKQYIKLYKKIHCLAYSKLDRPALIALAENMRQHEASARLTDEQFEAHMASLRRGRDHVRGSKPSADTPTEPKAPRKSTENQQRHRKLFGEWRKSKTTLSWKDWLVQHGTSKVETAEKKKPVVKRMPKEEPKKLIMPKEEEPKKKPVVKRMPKAKKLVMPVVEMETKAVAELVKDVTPEKKKKKVLVMPREKNS